MKPEKRNGIIRCAVNYEHKKRGGKNSGTRDGKQKCGNKSKHRNKIRANYLNGAISFVIWDIKANNSRVRFRRFSDALKYIFFTRPRILPAS